MDKVKSLYFLIGLLIVLSIIKLFISQTKTVEKPLLPKLTSEFVKTKIDSVLELYEIDNKWIKEKKSKDNKSFSYEVRLPVDLPIPILIVDFNEIVKDFSSIIKVQELSQITGITNIDFKNDTENIFSLKLIYDKNISRKRISFGFILYDISDLSNNELKNLIILPHHFLGLIRPSMSNVSIKDTLTKHQKSFAILLNTKINDEKYIIRNSFSKLRIRSSIVNIFNDFRNNKGLYIENDFYTNITNHKTYIESEFSRLKFDLHSFKNIVDIREKEIVEQKSLFKYYMETNPTENKIIFLANAKDFHNLVVDIEKYKKKGNKLLEF